ncbi:membrane-spanning 4-domains subfamily A member 8-like [Lithobates pipiens]
MDEITNALKQLKPGKSPGPDGLTVAYYKTFADILKPHFLSALKSFTEPINPPAEFLQAHITVIPKSGKDPSVVTNYRPISLLNVDLKWVVLSWTSKHDKNGLTTFTQTLLIQIGKIFSELSRHFPFIMTSPISDSVFSYEAVPTNISSHEPVLSTSIPNPMEIVQPESSVYNVPQGPPTVNMFAASPQWNINVPLPQIPLSTTFHQTFLKGKPFALGVVLICAGTFNVIMGIAMIFSIFRLSLISGNPFWAAVAYIITGIMTLSAYSKISLCRVRGSFAMNVISALMSGVGIILACLDLSALSFLRCRQYGSYYCSENVGGIVVHSLTLVNNLLILCVSISLGIFGCLSLGDVPSIQQVFLLHNGVMVPVSATATTSPPLPQYPIPNFVQGDVKNQPTITITQSP